MLGYRKRSNSRLIAAATDEDDARGGDDNAVPFPAELRQVGYGPSSAAGTTATPSLRR